MNQQAFWKSCEGTQFSSKYYLQELLGVGGFGAVFKADDVVADRCVNTVALKIFNPFQTSDLNAFIQEFKSTNQLHHTHLIKTDVLAEGKLQGAIDSLGLVMELAGEDLGKRLERSLLTPAEATVLVQHVAAALQYLHSISVWDGEPTKGIVHRDIKPQNIMAVGSGANLTWKVGDLGIVRVLGNQTTTLTTNRQGSPFYVPPEAYSGQVSPAMDMWALGVTIVQALTNQVPFPGPTEAQVMNQVLNEEPRLPTLPEPFKAIVRGCFIKDPKSRWTADRVLAALDPKRSAPSPQPISRPFDLGIPDFLQRRRPNPSQYGKESLGSPNQTFDLPSNGGKLELIAVPGGTLVMESGHRVQLRPFLMGKYPVTQRQYQAVMGQNPSRFKESLECPVEMVPWQQAIVFCQKLSKILNRRIDLPSETQWEWAARGATQSKGFVYAGSNNLDEVGWYNGNSDRTTHPVGQKKPNELGLYDMSGNVWEWCLDNWAYSSNALPGDGTPYRGGDSSYHAVRGGSWGNHSSDCRCAQRIRDLNRYFLPGFRVVLSGLSGVSGVSL